MTTKDAIGLDLPGFLAAHARPDIARIVTVIAEVSVLISQIIRRGPLDGALGANAGSVNQDGDYQKALDVLADERFIDALRGAGVAAIVSEERKGPEFLDADSGLIVAIDPLDGSSNIDANVSIGTIFSVMEVPVDEARSETAFLRAGHAQVAAGFTVYGPQTSLVFTTGTGTHLATLDAAAGQFYITRANILVPEGAPEFAINASNSRHWHAPIHAYIDDCVEGIEGPRGKNFNMRWIASLVADAFRIFARGGVYLYPADKRKGYERGRLRHLYEANPIAMLAEQAGGAATDGVNRILDTVPAGIHDRIPLVFGSLDKVDRVRRYHLDTSGSDDRPPLFGRRGLLRG